jgi:hypothetical protein
LQHSTGIIENLGKNKQKWMPERLLDFMLDITAGYLIAWDNNIALYSQNKIVYAKNAFF